MNIRKRCDSLSLILVFFIVWGVACCGGRCGADDSKKLTAEQQTAPSEVAPQEIEKVEGLIRAATELREKLQRDPQRPAYHFLPPWGWMNDPNGTIFWKGKYHLFYQYSRNEAFQKIMEWGHASSIDLIHWTHHAIALTPTPGAADRSHCFSGVAVNNHGVPTLIYHGVPDGTCIATSQDDDLIRWTKSPQNPVIAVPEQGRKVEYRVYDPCAWKLGDMWYALCGGGRNFAHPDAPPGDTAFLFKSPDLTRWEYMHPFYQSDRRWTDADEDCAVPDFFPLGKKYVLFFASHKRGAQYYIGRYENDHFYPERHARMNWSGGQLIAPITMLDGRGRRILFAWLNEARSEPRHRVAGWAGVMTLPRIVTLTSDNTLRIEPTTEIEMLRFNHRKRGAFVIAADSELNIDEMRGDCLEIQLEIAPNDAKQVGLIVRCSPDGAEQTSIIYDAVAKTLAIDGSQSSRIIEQAPFVPILPPAERLIRTQTAPFEVPAGEPLKLRVFLDRSVVEVFVNDGRQTLSQRIYPSRTDSLGVRVFSRGGQAKVNKIEAWDMAAAGG
jgi:beta-fructofuranosidase